MIEAAAAAGMIDRDRVWGAKRQALSVRFQAESASTEWRGWARARGSELWRFCTWNALADRFGARPFTVGGMLLMAATFVALVMIPVNFNYLVFAVLVFLFIYVCCVVTMTLILLASGLDAVTAFSAVIASINNTGPGLGVVGPSTTYEVLEDFQTWVCTATMLLGRLELFTMLVLFTPAFWRK